MLIPQPGTIGQVNNSGNFFHIVEYDQQPQRSLMQSQQQQHQHQQQQMWQQINHLQLGTQNQNVLLFHENAVGNPGFQPIQARSIGNNLAPFHYLGVPPCNMINLASGLTTGILKYSKPNKPVVNINSTSTYVHPRNKAPLPPSRSNTFNRSHK